MKHSARPGAGLCLAFIALLLTGSACATSAADDPTADVDTGATPGTYSYWVPPADPTSFSMPMILVADPGNYNAYWSNQFSLNDAAHTGGYLGFQTHDTGGGMFLGSLRNAKSAKPGSDNTYCAEFGGAGGGMSCRWNERPRPGDQYLLTVSKAGSHGWTFTVVNSTANTTTVLGTIYTETDAKLSGADFVSWTEYFDWNNPATTCAQAKYSKLLFGIPATSAGNGHYTGTDTRKRCPQMERVTLSPAGATQENGPQP